MKKNDVIIFNSKELHNISFDNSQPYERVVIHFNPVMALPYDTEKYKEVLKDICKHYQTAFSLQVIEG